MHPLDVKAKQKGNQFQIGNIEVIFEYKQRRLTQTNLVIQGKLPDCATHIKLIAPLIIRKF